MTSDSVTISIPKACLDRLTALVEAQSEGPDVTGHVEQAILDYLEMQEDFNRSMETLAIGEDRPELKASLDGTSDSET